MPILQCEECGYTFAYLGKSLGVRCPQGCGQAFSPVKVHVDRHLVTDIERELIDGRYTDIELKDEPRQPVIQPT